MTESYNSVRIGSRADRRNPIGATHVGQNIMIYLILLKSDELL
jgi:hypothetical protein